jgi:hypothetical protein
MIRPHNTTTMGATEGSAVDVFNSTGALPLLPDELLIHILEFLDIPDLLSTSRVGTNKAQYDRG